MQLIEQQRQSQEAGFPYASGTTQELLGEMAERRADTGLQQRLEEYFLDTIGPDFSFRELHETMFPGDGQDGTTPLDIQLATHLAKPDLNTLSVAMAVQLLRDAGYPVRFTIRTLPSDVYVDASKDPSGIKPACVNVPMAVGTRAIQIQPLAAEPEAMNRRLEAIQLPNGMNLDEYTRWITQEAGIRAAIADGSVFHKLWLERMLAAGTANRDKEFKKSRLFMAQADGTRTALDPLAATVAYQQATPAERAILAERLSPSADMYYRLVPIYLAGFVGGQRLLVENYDDDPGFVKRVNSGIGKLRQVTGMNPAVARSNWLYAVDPEQGLQYAGMNTQWETTYTSLTIPVRLIGNPALQNAYRRFVSQQVLNQYGDPGSVSMTELQQATLQASVGFLETDTYNQ